MLSSLDYWSCIILFYNFNFRHKKNPLYFLNIILPVADNCDVELLFFPIPEPNLSLSRLIPVSLFGDR